MATKINSNEKEQKHQIVGGGGETLEEGDDILKKRIACHSLYGLLVETHLNCLKVCVGNITDIGRIQKIGQQAHNQPSFSTVDQTELDQFMEAYCMALSKLKDAIEEPQEETMAFINSMHSQLKELMELPFTAALPTTTSSGKQIYATPS
ncbi:unnamed protein product [Ilex paraguariensis]|uniref:Uncharacterized protein n=1 Tax=Ilex paraguariensis TaxID=185542 RepID=A0ABC8TP24_9AQUA